MNEQWNELKETIVEIRDNNTYENEDVTNLCRFLANYMGILEDQMSGSENLNKWIPVSERLPEEEGNYLVTFVAFAETIKGEKVIFGDIDGSVSEIGYGCYERDIFGNPTAFGWYDLATTTPFDKRAIIAWMPLPKSYKAESEDKE